VQWWVVGGCVGASERQVISQPATSPQLRATVGRGRGCKGWKEEVCTVPLPSPGVVVVVTCCAPFTVCGADRRQRERDEGGGECDTLEQGSCGGAPRMRQQSLRPPLHLCLFASRLASPRTLALAPYASITRGASDDPRPAIHRVAACQAHYSVHGLCVRPLLSVCRLHWAVWY
jgi:hypothetical protein